MRGNTVVGGYFNDPEANKDAFDGEGWFRTGDIAVMDADGSLQLTDRAKDLIKSGGEWISSIGLENAASGHPAVEAAAAIAVPQVIKYVGSAKSDTARIQIERLSTTLDLYRLEVGRYPRGPQICNGFFHCLHPWKTRSVCTGDDSLQMPRP